MRPLLSACVLTNAVDSITCRKRHLKCYEVKPICGPCARKEKLCDYATSASRSANTPATEKANTQTTDVTTAQQPAPALHEQAPISSDNAPVPAFDEHAEPVAVSWLASDAISTLPNLDLLDHSSANGPVSNHSPVAYRHDYLSLSNASFAAVQWFGLLASDAARESPHLANNSQFRSTLGPRDVRNAFGRFGSGELLLVSARNVDFFAPRVNLANQVAQL